MLYRIFGLICAITLVSAAENNDTDLTGRYYGSYEPFPSHEQNRCISRNRRSGKCVPLQRCPELQELSKKYNPMYVLQAVSDYTCGFSDRAVQVCCPDQVSGFSQPLIDQSRPSNSAPIPFPDDSNSNRPVNNARPSSNNNFNRPKPTNNFNRPNPSNNFFNPSFNNNFNRPNPNNNFNNPNNNFNNPNPNNNFNNPNSNNNFNNPNFNNNFNNPNFNNNGRTPIPKEERTTETIISNTNNNGPIPFPLVESTPETTTVRNRVPKPTTESNPGFTTIHRNRRLLPETTCGLSVEGKILGGVETSLEDYPWMALLRLRFGNGRTVFSCGGSLIGPRYVLTAAHCIKNPEIPPSAQIDQVRLGEYDQDEEVDCTKDRQCSPPPENIEIEERIVHSKYNMNDKTQQNDIALLRLKRPVKFSSYIMPICLPLDSVKNNNYDGTRLWTAGWGKTSNGRNSQSPIKLKVDLPVIPFAECSSSYSQKKMFLTESQICAGGEANRDSCNGDSGGPLMSQDKVGKQFRWHVQGIVSIGPMQCGTAGSPGIYTKVSDFTDWILDNMRE